MENKITCGWCNHEFVPKYIEQKSDFMPVTIRHAPGESAQDIVRSNNSAAMSLGKKLMTRCPKCGRDIQTEITN